MNGYLLEVTGYRPWYTDPCPGWDPALPRLDALLALLRRGVAPPPTPGDRGLRLAAMRRAGWPIPVEWRERPSEAEADVWWEVLCLSALGWREVVVPIRGIDVPPYRIDLVVTRPAGSWWSDPDWWSAAPELNAPPRRAPFEVVAVEIDGSSHRSRADRDARRDAFVESRFGVRTLRFPADTHPRDVASAVLPYLADGEEGE